MRRLLLLSAALIACAACQSEAPKPPEPDTFDVPAAAASLADRGGIATALVHYRLLTAALVNETATANPASTTGQIADAIAATAAKAKTGCGGLNIVHTPGTNLVNITLPTNACKIADLQTSGLIDVSVSLKDGAVAVAIKLSAVKVRGHALDGTAALTTTDGKTFATEITNLKVDGLLWNWSGTPALDAGGQGATLTGSGSVSKDGGPTIAVQIKGVHRKFAACYPDSGTIAQTFQVALTAPKAKAGTLLDATATASFDAETPRDGTVDVTLQVGKLPNATHKNAVLPKYGDCPDGTAP